MKTEIQFRLRIRSGEKVAIGPGKIDLLEAIAATGSISAAAKSLNMSYRRAWLLVDEMNQCMTKPMVEVQIGGSKGGGTLLTGAAMNVIERYRAIEQIATDAAAKELKVLTDMIAR